MSQEWLAARLHLKSASNACQIIRCYKRGREKVDLPKPLIDFTHTAMTDGTSRSPQMQAVNFRTQTPISTVFSHTGTYFPLFTELIRTRGQTSAQFDTMRE